MLNVLQQHQSEFVSALLNHQGDHGTFVKKIIKTSKIDPRIALDIYRNNTRSSRLKSLEMIYPVCRKIMGGETFRQIGQQYAIDDTEGASDLNQYGKSFKLYLKSLLEVGRLPEQYLYLIDLVDLEYKMHAAYYANADPEFPFKRFDAKVKNADPIFFKISSALGLMVSQYPVYEIWKSNKEQRYVREIEPIDGKQYLLVYRSDYKSSVVAIDENEYNVINAVVNNLSLQEIINNTNNDINNIIPNLIANKWIVGIR